jgi:hypothetical protein
VATALFFSIEGKSSDFCDVPLPFAPAIPTEFELTVRRLRLTPQLYVSSRELKRWWESNRNRCYVPEWLLKQWDPDVELYHGPEAA